MSQPKTSAINLIGGFLFFFFFSAVALYGLSESIVSVIVDLLHSTPSIEFNKGGLYGVGFLASVIFSWGFVVTLIKGQLTTRQERNMGRALIASVVLMFTFPHVVHFATSEYLRNKGYSKCEPMTRRWMHNVTFIYTITTDACDHLVDER